MGNSMTLWRTALGAPLWVKLLGANVIIAIAAVFAVRSAAAAAGISSEPLMESMFIALAVSGAINIALVVIALRPLRTLERTAASVWRGDTSARVPSSLLADRDMARVGHTLNLVVDALTADRARAQRFAVQVMRQSETDQAGVAHELHESAAQTLAAQMLQLSAIAHATSDEETRDQLKNVRAMAAETLDQLRALALRMHPLTLDNLGLEAALPRLASRAREQYRCPVDLSLELQDDVPVDVASVIYSAADEAIDAALGSGNATFVRLCVAAREGVARLGVEHDGTVSEEMASTFAARQRVVLAGGRYDVSYSPESGTRIAATLSLAAMAGPEGVQ
jgi:signal transduction histidine kinase